MKKILCSSRSFVRAFERTTVRVVRYWAVKSGFLEESVYRVADHCTHTADFAGAFFLVSTFAEGVHLVFIELKRVARNDSLPVRPFRRSGVRPFGCRRI